MGRTIVRAGIIISEATGRQGTQAGTDPVGTLEAIGPEATLQGETMGPTGPGETRERIVLVGIILGAIGPEKTMQGTARVGALAGTPPGETQERIVPAGTLEAIGLGETLRAGTLGRIDLVGILERIDLGETREGILQVATDPGQVEGRAVRRVGPLWVVRRVGNDRNRLRVRGRVGLEGITMARPRGRRAIVAEPVLVAATREVKADETLP